MADDDLKITTITAHWDGMAWPRTGQALDELEWRLRDGTEAPAADATWTAGAAAHDGLEVYPRAGAREGG